MLRQVCTFAFVAALASAACALELTTNGDFETGDTSGWVSFPTANSTFNITSDANSGAWAAELFNNDSASAAIIKQANIGIGVVNPGDIVNISFAAKGSFAAGGVSFAEFFTELDGGGTSSSEILSGGPLALTDQYQVFNFSTVAGPNTSGGVTLQLTATTGGAPGSTAVLFVDDVSVSVIPEPATALLGLLGLGLVAVRRR